MIVLRIQGGGLLLHSVVALDEDGLTSLRALGSVSYIVVPHEQHQLDTAFYRDRFPTAKVLAPATARQAVERRGRLDGTVEDVLPGLGFALHLPPGTRVPEYVYEWPLPTGGRLLMMSDLLGGVDAADRSKFRGRTLVSFISAAPAPLGLTRIYRWMMAEDTTAIRQFAHSLADINDIQLITVSHGEPVREDCAAALRAV
jgi:hypothetical protein